MNMYETQDETHLLKGLAALVSNLVLVAFGDLVEGSTL